MGATYTRQSSFTDGDVITADLFNNEYDQLLAAFAASTGHTHDGTAAEGGPITKLLGTSITIGDATSGTDITVTFDGETNDGVFKWMEDEDYFEFSDDLLIASTEKIQFRDTAIYINSSTDGQLDIVADSEIQIAATTIDINGNVDISGTLTIGGAGISEAELEILDGATVTTTEINILDGDTTASSTTVADADRVVFNDAGTMKQVAVTDLAAYFDDEITAMPNLVTTAATTVGALNSGSITSGFGTIDTGSSTITTTGLISGGSLDIDDVLINGTTIGHTDDTDLITLANGVVTVAGEVSMTTLDIGGTNVTSTAAELNIVDGGTSATATTVADADRVVMNDNGTMVQVAVTDLAAYFDDEITAMPNLVTTAATTVGALNSGSITSGFGTIDTGSSAITTTGVITGGTLEATTDTAAGDNAAVGYTSAEGLILTGQGSTSDITFKNDADATVFSIPTGTDDILFPDNAKILMGASSDLSLYHDGSNSYIKDSGTGILVLKASQLNVNSTTDASLATFIETGAVSLYHNNALKLATTATGVDVTGIIVSDGMSTNTSGTSNFIAGVNAGNSIASGGDKNVLIGDEAGTAITTGDRNTAVGFEALKTEDAHGRNVAIGYHALEDLNAGADALNIGIGYNAGANLTTGIRNTLIGGNAADDLTDADDNVAIGRQALSSDTLGSKSVAIGNDTLFAQNFTSATDSYNTAVGYAAGAAITTGVSNTAIGALALDANTTASNNTAVGYQALTANTTAALNTAVGYQSMDANTTGVSNTSVGGHSLGANVTGNSLTAVGSNALLVNTTSSNTAVGANAAYSNTSGHIDAFGVNAAYSNTTGNYNSAFGQQNGYYAALQHNTTGSSNAAFATGALGNTTTGSSNTGIGVAALYSNTTASDNTAVGYQAGYAITTGQKNVAIGGTALKTSATGYFQTAVGYGALTNSNYTANVYAYNTAVGYNAGAANTTGKVTAVGASTLQSNTTGINNAAFGGATDGFGAALQANTTGSNNTGLGYGALTANTTASSNTAVGYYAGLVVTTGVQNTFVGVQAGDGTDDGNNNTAVGYLALSANCGSHNTAIGQGAASVCTGANNTSLGSGAAAALTSGSNNLLLGKDAGITGSPGGSIGTSSNKIVLGDESIAEANIQVDWTVASDQRDKTDFTALDLGLDFVKALAPVTYKWDKRSKYGDKSADDYDLAAQSPDGTHKEDWLDIGFKAQEVQALEEAAGYTTASKKNLTVSTSDDGKQMGLQYSKFVPILVKAIQELSAKNDALEARITALEGN